MLSYKFDVLEKLRDAGYSTYRLRKEKLLGEANIQRLRKSEMVGAIVLNDLCRLLNCQPGDLLEYSPDNEETPGQTSGG